MKARFAFEAMCWPDFAANTTRLTKVWRQSDPDFLNVLNYVRHGHGADAARLLTSLGVQWHNVRDVDFPGTTLLPTNDLCRRHNEMCLSALRGKPFRLVNHRWGRQRNEWGLSTRTKEWGIPPVTELKLGCYVMIRANRPGLTLCNGDCGTVVGIDYDNPANGVDVMILRTGKVERVTPVVRDVGGKDRPNDWQESYPRISSAEDEGEYLEKCHFRGRVRRYVEGQIQYYPLQLAYASTVHKSQGLSLDRVQVDYRGEFFGSPHMVYVALSRCRSLEGLRMVGMPEVFAKRVKIDARVRAWL